MLGRKLTCCHHKNKSRWIYVTQLNDALGSPVPLQLLSWIPLFHGMWLFGSFFEKGGRPTFPRVWNEGTSGIFISGFLELVDRALRCLFARCMGLKNAWSTPAEVHGCVQTKAGSPLHRIKGTDGSTLPPCKLVLWPESSVHKFCVKSLEPCFTEPI